MNKKIEFTRNLLVQIALDDICSVEDFSDFYFHTYYVIAKLGLQRIAKVEKLFKTIDWDNGAFKEAIFKKIKSFLTNILNNSNLLLSLRLKLLHQLVNSILSLDYRLFEFLPYNNYS